MSLIESNYQKWLNSPRVSQEDKNVILKMNKDQIDDAFFKDVEFGTAGMRGILGPGTNRLNLFTITKANVAFAKYLLELFPDAKNKGVVISHDNRHMSREFTLKSAQILNDFGINTFIFDSLRPTPELSFAVRYQQACGGIMVTASHNPKEHNGFKVYDETGCQLIPSKIKRLLEIIEELGDPLDVTYEAVKEKGINKILGPEIDDEYVRLVESIAINKDLDKSDFKIVFTPNHGTSYVNAMRIFKDLGYDVAPVLSQCEPDPNFSGTLSPNPEDPRSFIEPLKLAKEVTAKLVVMTDPDGDRVGLGYLSSKGTYETFTGNQSAAILMDYLFSQMKEKGTFPKDPVMYNTIVTSPIGEKVASLYGVKTEQFLTGFKFIGNRIDYYEKNGGPTFVFGYEESYGCLASPFARDKDGLQAILLYSEMALYYDKLGKPLDVVWDELQQRVGYHLDLVYSLDFVGPKGQADMNALMSTLHNDPWLKVGESQVIQVNDYKKQVSMTGEQADNIDLPVSDVVKLYFDNQNIICVRPSGTEPKVKFYISMVSDKQIDAKEAENYYSTFKKTLGI